MATQRYRLMLFRRGQTSSSPMSQWWSDNEQELRSQMESTRHTIESQGMRYQLWDTEEGKMIGKSFDLDSLTGFQLGEAYLRCVGSDASKVDEQGMRAAIRKALDDGEPAALSWFGAKEKTA